MGLATAYVSVLGHASAAESLTAHALTDSARWVSGTEAGLADMLYSLDAARHEYRCAGQVLDPFRASGDSAVRAFAVETQDVFDTFASWVVHLTAQLRRRLSGESLTVLAEADTIAAMHKRRDALTQLLGLNSTGVTYLLLDSAEAGTHKRLVLTRAQRDSVARQLRTISRSQFPEVATTARSIPDLAHRSEVAYTLKSPLLTCRGGPRITTRVANPPLRAAKAPLHMWVSRPHLEPATHGLRRFDLLRC